MRVIDVEAHFYTEEYVKELYKYTSYPRYQRDKAGNPFLYFYTDLRIPQSRVIDKLTNFERRLKDMDDAEVDVQVLSLSVPGCESFDAQTGTRLSKMVNDRLAQIMEKNPARFIGLAAIAPQDHDNAADELKRAIDDLGFQGLKLHSNVGGVYLDAPQFDCIFEKAERLKVPILVHPTQSQIPPFKGYGYSLAGPAFGYTFDAAVSALRIILSGLLDKYPTVKIVLGHLGEALPFIIRRINFAYDHEWLRGENMPKLRKKPSDYLMDNFYFNTCGNFHQPALKCTHETFGVDRIVFASDYPYEDTKAGVSYVNDSSLSLEDKERIFHLNAEKVFLRPTQ